jgi:stage III sporulation protein SpoIIIAA
MRLLVIVIFHTLELVGETDAGSKTELQHQVMIEAVENHMPQVIIIDEIGTELEVLAARTIAEKGVQLVGTTHGNCLENLIKKPSLGFNGGIQYFTLVMMKLNGETKRVFLKEKLTLRLKS